MIRIASPGPTGTVGACPAGELADDPQPHRARPRSRPRCRRPAPRSRPSRCSRTAAPARRGDAGSASTSPSASAERDRRRGARRRHRAEDRGLGVGERDHDATARRAMPRRARARRAVGQRRARGRAGRARARCWPGGSRASGRCRSDRRVNTRPYTVWSSSSSPIASVSCSSPPRAGLDAVERVEDLGREHVAADHREVRRRVLAARLLDDRRARARARRSVDLGLDAAVRRRSRRRVTSMQREHRAPVALVHVEHRAEQLAVVDHDVVAEQHRERLVADVLARDRHRVPETERVALADVVDVGELARSCTSFEQVVLARLLEVVLELEVAVEVVLDRALAAAGDDEDVGEPGRAPPPRPRTGSTACRRPAASPWAGSSSPAGTASRVPRPG